MKLGVFAVLFAEKSLDEMLDHVKDAGLQAVELGTGGNPGDANVNLDALLESEEKKKDFLDKVHSRRLTNRAFSCHNNPITPHKAHAEEAHETFTKSVKLAEMLDVPVVNT